MSKNRNQLFETILKAKNKNLYWKIIFELRNFVDQEMVDQCFTLINSKEDKLKIIGIDILSQLGINREEFSKTLLQNIFRILPNTENEDLIHSCLIAIGHNNNNLSHKQLKVLENFKKSKSKDIRYALVFSIMSIEIQIAIDILIFLSKDKSPKVRDWAVFCIGTQISNDNQQIRDVLFERCFDKDDQTKQEAIKGLSIRKDERVNEVILQELKSENFDSLLFDTILSLENGKIFLPELKKIYKKLKEDPSINKEWLKELNFCLENL